MPPNNKVSGLALTRWYNNRRVVIPVKTTEVNVNIRFSAWGQTTLTPNTLNKQ